TSMRDAPRAPACPAPYRKRQRLASGDCLGRRAVSCFKLGKVADDRSWTYDEDFLPSFKQETALVPGADGHCLRRKQVWSRTTAPGASFSASSSRPAAHASS